MVRQLPFFSRLQFNVLREAMSHNLCRNYGPRSWRKRVARCNISPTWAATAITPKLGRVVTKDAPSWVTSANDLEDLLLSFEMPLHNKNLRVMSFGYMGSTVVKPKSAQERQLLALVHKLMGMPQWLYASHIPLW